MPRFPVAFGKRRSTANNLEDVPVAGSSFRVLERAEVTSAKSFDGGARLAAKAHHMPQTSVSAISVEDNLFAGLTTHPNRGSGSSNTTKTASTDNSSRHSNLSTAPSSADFTGEEEGRSSNKTQQRDLPRQPAGPRVSNSGFLRSAGRTFSFGGQKKHLPPVPAEEEPMPESPWQAASSSTSGRARATTSSTATTVTPPKIETDVSLDLGGDFSKLLLGFDKRASVLTLRNDAGGAQSPATRNLTGGRGNQPTPIQIDRSAKIEASPYSWNSQHSGDRLLTASPAPASPSNGPASGSLLPGRSTPAAGTQRKPVASGDSGLRRGSAILGGRTSAAGPKDQDDEEAILLKDSLSAVNKFMSGGAVADRSSAARSRRNDDTQAPRGRTTGPETKSTEDNLFESSFAQAGNLARRYVSRQPSPPRNKVMTPAQFERYREDRERRESMSTTSKPSLGNEDEDNYEDDDDEAEKAKQAAKQRRKQEAHISVYRQQMMKVTGESSGGASSRPSLSVSFSTPNLTNLSNAGLPGRTPNGSDGSDEDEEVPLAILAAHGFPNKNRPPTRLSTMISNPNMRASQVPSYQRPGSVVGDAGVAAGNSRLPAFAKNLPQDPFVGAGLVHNPVRESFALGGGAPAPAPGQLPHPSAAPTPGGLIGVIASEERSRALRRGSPKIDGQIPTGYAPNAYDAINGIPPNMMYPGAPQMPNPMMLTPGDQAQMQMNQQMQQFMQMQMQFMQMVAAQNTAGGMPGMNPMAAQSMGNLSAMGPGMGPGMTNDPGRSDSMARQSFLGDGPMAGLPNVDNRMRTMSMVQPSSASWYQAAPQPGYAPSIRAQGYGYAPSIAPSERSNVGLPGRYRPVSQAPPPMPLSGANRSSTVPAGFGNWAPTAKPAAKTATKSGNASDEEDEDQGWAAMKAKREKKRSIWKSKKSFGAELGALIS